MPESESTIVEVHICSRERRNRMCPGCELAPYSEGLINRAESSWVLTQFSSNTDSLVITRHLLWHAIFWAIIWEIFDSLASKTVNTPMVDMKRKLIRNHP